MSNDHKKKRQIEAKGIICTKNFARKRCPPNQLNIKLITKNNKNLRLHFMQVTTFVGQMTLSTVKRKQKPTKKGQICKTHEN